MTSFILVRNSSRLSALAMSSRKTRHVTDIQRSIRASFYDVFEALHKRWSNFNFSMLSKPMVEELTGVRARPVLLVPYLLNPINRLDNPLDLFHVAPRNIIRLCFGQFRTASRRAMQRCSRTACRPVQVSSQSHRTLSSFEMGGSSPLSISTARNKAAKLARLSLIRPESFSTDADGG